MAVSITRTANPAGVSASSNVATYTGASIGTAAPNRIVVVTVASELASTPIASCTIDGNAMNAGTQGNQGAVYSRLFYLLYPTGTTADIAVTFTTNSPTSTQNHIAVYTVTDAVVSSVGGAQSTDMDATAPLTTGSITIASGGGFIAVAGKATDTVRATWANATEDIDDDAGALGFTTATRTTALTTTAVTCTGGTNGEDGAISWIIFADNSSPTTALNTPADSATGQTTTPTLNFTGTDADSDAVEYEVQVDTVNTFDSQQTIAHDADSASAAQTTSTSYSWNHTCTGSDLVLVVGFALRPYGASVATLTYNGVSMTKIRGENDAAFNRVTELWYLMNPSTGTNSIAVTLTGSPSHSTGHATSLTGVQGLDANNGAKQTGADTHPVVSVTTVSDNSWIVDTLCTDWDDNVATPDSPQTLSSKTVATGAHTGAMSYQGPVTTPGATNEGYTVTSGQWAISAASFKPLALVDALSASDAGFTAGHPFASGAAKDYTVQSALSNSTVYYWRVRAIDPTGSNSYGAWATTRSFTTTSGSVAPNKIYQFKQAVNRASTY